MKVIDLLNKIAKGETPKKIIYLPYASNNEYAGKYSYKDGDYLKDGWSNMWLFKDHLKAKLNDEVEIIEEDKNIKKLKIEHMENNPSNKYIVNEFGTKCFLTKHSKILADKINEIIDDVNKLKNN